MKIKLKMSLIFLGVFVVIMAAAGLFIGFYSNNSLRNQIDSYLYSSGRARAEHVRTFIQDKIEDAKILAASSVYRDLLKDTTSETMKQKVTQRLVRTIEVDSDMLETFLINSDGIVVASSDQSREGEDRSSDPYFTGAKKEAYFKSIYYSETINKLTYSLSAPINDENGNFLGVSVVRYSPDRFFSIVKAENGLGDTEENFLINEDRYFITPSRFLGNDVILKQKVNTVNGDQCFEQKNIDYIVKNGYSGVRDFKGDKFFVAANDYRGIDIIGTNYYIPETGWCLITKVDSSAIYQNTMNLIWMMMTAFGVSVIIFIIVCFFVARRITNPIARLRESAEKIKQGDLDTPIAQKGRDEIGDLSRTMDKMAKSIISSRLEIDAKVEEQTKQIVQKDTDLENKQKAMINVLEDIKDEKEKLAKIADDLEKFQLAVDGVSDHIVITDPEGIIIYMNDAAARITGFSIDYCMGKKSGSPDLWGGNMPKEFYADFWNTIKVKKQPFSGVFENKRKNGQKYEAAASVTPILGENNEVKYFVGIERDVTKEREVDKAKTEFVSLASHQLRTPLSAINWYTEMLLDGDAGKLNKDQTDYLNQVYSSNQRMVDLVNSLLNVSRLDLGTFIVEPEKLDITKISTDVVKEMAPMVNKKKQKIVENYSSELTMINADPKLTRIILQNLLSNAVKYTQNDGEISVSIKNKGDRKIEIKVEDNGMGIPAAQQDKIFTKLFRADNVKSSDTEGTGLGMYIVKSIIEQVGGSIEFSSQENKGTVFTVDLLKSGMKEKQGDKTLES